MSCWGIECCDRKIFSCKCGDGEIDLSTQAFGLPPKTVRAMLAFIIVIITFFCYVGAITVFAVNGQHDLLLGTLTAMTNVMSICLGFYFGSRSKPDPPKQKKMADEEMTDASTFEG